MGDLEHFLLLSLDLHEQTSSHWLMDVLDKKRIDFCTTCGSTLLDYSGYPKAICRPNSCLFNIVLPVPLNRTCHAQLGGGSIAQVIHNLRSRYGTDISESSLKIACFN